LKTPFKTIVKPDFVSLLNCLSRKGTPERVHQMEIIVDPAIQSEICNRYGVGQEISPTDPYKNVKRKIAFQRFLGYDFLMASLWEFTFQYNWDKVADESALKNDSKGERSFMNMHKGPISNWDDFEKYPWPDISNINTKELEWVNKNLPEDMCLAGGLTGHIAEDITFLMGYEQLCIALYEQRDLVKAIYTKVLEHHHRYVELLLQFDRVKMIWATDDMGFKTGPMFSPDDFREFVFPAHKTLAKMAHDKNVLYLLHACGKLDLLMDDLIHDVKIDAKHSFEDTILHVGDAKVRYGNEIAVIGGIVIDFLCRTEPEMMRERVRKTIFQCLPGGGYCLGSGNSIANYIPVDNYLSMVDEGRNYAA